MFFVFRAYIKPNHLPLEFVVIVILIGYQALGCSWYTFSVKYLPD